MNPITVQYFTNNRSALRSKVDSSIPIVLTAASEVQRSTDSAHRFRQDMNFWYVTGITDPGYIVVLVGDKSVLICPKQSRIKSVFDGVLSGDELRQISGIETVLSSEDGNEYLKNLVSGQDTVATLLPARGLQTHYGIVPNPARDRLIKKLKRIRPGLHLQHIGKEFASLRMIKQVPEIAAIQSAIDCTIEAFELVKPEIQQSTAEYQLDGIMTGFIRGHSARHAYEPIIAAGQRACTLHYSENSKDYSRADNMILFDVGAEMYHFASDISRTYSIGKPSSRLRDVHAAVQAVQQYAYRVLKPGLAMREYEASIEAEMGKQLKQLGLISSHNRVDIRRYYPHATSHHLGLDVHDVAEYDIPFNENMILTVEPGIYIPEESIAVRIEDNVRITKIGVDILSGALSTDL